MEPKMCRGCMQCRGFRVGRFHLYQEWVAFRERGWWRFRHGPLENAVAYRSWSFLGLRLLLYRSSWCSPNG